MRLGAEGFFHLTYCTKIHPGSGWEELCGHLRRYVPALKARLAPEAPFGLGLRLSADESLELLAGNNLGEFQDFLAAHGLYVFTLNGFPYGDLTGPAVKSQIFAPDWREAARVSYTLDLIEILRRLLPAGAEGSISTTPLSYKAWMAAGDAGAWTVMVANLVRVVERLARIRAAEEKMIHLDLEPEPDGLLERSAEVAEFFRTWLLPVGGPLLAKAAGVDESEARRLLLDHIRVCLDTCHLAVAFENPVAALNNLAEPGIQVGKVQITAGLQVAFPAEVEGRAALAAQLRPFTRSPYLHQVIGEPESGRRARFPDLAPALAQLSAGPARGWRIHYHMPLFVEQYGQLASTAGDTRAVLTLLKERGFCRHLEIETYTWEWLPPDLKVELLDSLHREYLWVLEAMGFAA